MHERYGSPWLGWLLSAPGTLALSVLVLAPGIATGVLSLSDWQFGAGSFNWIGIDNFAAMWRDETFWKAFRNTLLYIGVVVPASVGLGLLLALLIESDPGFRAFYRAAFFLPVASTLIAMAVVWQFMLHPTAGLVNFVLGWFGVPQTDWLKNPDTALWAIIAIGIWSKTGLAMVLFMAGLQSIPHDLYLAGEIDGIDAPSERVFRITIPMLGPTTLFVLTISAIQAFQVFDTVQVMTEGGPNKTSEVLLHLIYSEGFVFFRAGYAAALTVVYLLVVLFMVQLQALVVERRVHYR
ncbi:MAG: sugar ABC transporter permease [Rhodospirillales bacterium]|nr:sugar ABC transporter permease [Rhodospirillales bacterium]